MAITIKGYVEGITYRNEENGYTVFRLSGNAETTVCVGILHFVNQGDCIEVEGEYQTHPVHGNQIAVQKYEITEPDDLISMKRYLGSGAIKGIREALADKIVEKFREETFKIIEDEPERLTEIKGISKRIAMQIADQVEGKKDFRRAMIFLQKYGISTALAAKVYQHYGQDIYGVIKENPYQLADEITGVGFKIADEIARKVGIHVDSDFRIQSGIHYTLLQCVSEGHVYLPKSVLLTRVQQLLEIEVENVERHLMDLTIEKKIVQKPEEFDSRIYPSMYYYMELNIAKMLHDLNVQYEVPDVVLENRICQIQKNTKQVLDEKQQRAVMEGVRNGLLILTGGPGTGKTTTINAMIQYFESEGLDVFLAAPTGRAAKRMSETTGCEARTIHRMLEVSGNPEEDGNVGFARNRQNPLEVDVIIIDEMSMVDLTLMHALLSAIVEGTRVILVGDKNQLPSVGPGSVLKDIIAADTFKVIELTKIFRQAGESDIVVNAHKINTGEEITLDNNSKDFFFLKRDDTNMIISNAIELIQKKLPKYVQASQQEIQVLTPMRKGMLGVERLNRILQQYLNPKEGGKVEKEVGERIFRMGDKVMQIKNNYQLEWEVTTKFGLVVDKGLGVYNGDMGIITYIDLYHEVVEVTFDEERKVNYPFKLLNELEHSYAITIHKSQGSEYPAVIIPLLQGPRLLYNRNLIYTAITRAKKCVTLIGDERTFREMINNTNEQKRYTSLEERIQEFNLSM